MKLRLKKLKPQQSVDTQDDAILESIKARLREMKVRAPRRPKNEDGSLLEPVLPADITAISDLALGKLHGEFACMAQYAQFQHALRAVEYSVEKRHDKITRAKVRMEKSGTNDDKAAKVEVDSRCRESSLRLLVGEGQERLTEAVLNGYTIGRDLCSREMTRRIGMTK